MLKARPIRLLLAFRFACRRGWDPFAPYTESRRCANWGGTAVCAATVALNKVAEGYHQNWQAIIPTDALPSAIVLLNESEACGTVASTQFIVKTLQLLSQQQAHCLQLCVYCVVEVQQAAVGCIAPLASGFLHEDKDAIIAASALPVLAMLAKSNSWK